MNRALLDIVNKLSANPAKNANVFGKNMVVFISNNNQLNQIKLLILRFQFFVVSVQYQASCGMEGFV